MFDRVEILGAGRGAEGGGKAIAGRRMADPGAGVDIVVAKAGADQLLDEIGLLVGAARRGDAADRLAAIGGLDAAQLRRGMAAIDGYLASGSAPSVAASSGRSTFRATTR